MSQFRNSADIIDEVLLKSGEPINGNSPFETRAQTYVNKAHHAIIGGGNIFNINVDEVWTWARSRFPITLELMPAYALGGVVCVVDENTIIFTLPPSVSLEGWHFQVDGTGTVYKIVQHNASSANAVIDSSFIDSSGSYSFRAFKLDYEIFPAFMYVDNYNDKIDFMEGTASTASATLTHGSYTPANLISHIATRLQAAGTKTYSGAYDTVLKQFTITQAGTMFAVLPVTGANYRRNGLTNAGYDVIDYTGAQTYTSTYTPNQISRLIEPFKLFVSDGCKPFIYSTDPIKMQQDYPISLTTEKIPDKFFRLSEDGSGTYWVRFNAYPVFKTKVQIDWIPQPVDIQDNRASFPMLPRADVDTLIHAASAFIAWDKEDSKWEGFVGLAKGGLDSMKKKNHSELFRTGESFGQIQPRLDYTRRGKDLRYGYTVSGAGNVVTSDTTNVLIAVTMSYTQFQVADTAFSVLARTLPVDRVLNSILLKDAISHTGPGITAMGVNVGITSSATYFINNFDPMQPAGANDSLVTSFYQGTATGVYVQLTSQGANLSALTQGKIILYFQESILP